MKELTRDMAAQAAQVRPVRLDDDLVTHVRPLPGARLAELVAAMQEEPAARNTRLAALCLCDARGKLMFEQVDPPVLDELATWPPVWVLKVADAAMLANGVYLEPDSPETEPGA